MKSFELVEPATVDEVVAQLDPENPGVRVIAGATALLLMMKARLFQPERLISLRRLTGAMRAVRDEGRGGVRIGAMTTLSELERELGEARFIRIHRSIIVNLDRVQGLELQSSGEYEVVLKSKVRLRLSRRFRKRLEDRMGAMSASD